MKIDVEQIGVVEISNREDYHDFLNSEGVKCLLADGVRKNFGNLVDGGTYALGPRSHQQVRFTGYIHFYVEPPPLHMYTDYSLDLCRCHF